MPAMTGLAQGAASIGLSYLTDELDIDPLLANMGFSAIATVINAGIQTGFSEKDDDIFDFVFKTYKDNALTLLGYVNSNDPNYLWKQAAYISQIQDFTDIIEDEGGLEQALNMYATSFFNSTAVNAIAQTGLTMGQYFVSQLPEIVGGIEKAIVSIFDGVVEVGKVIFGVNENGKWELTGVEYADSKKKGELGVDSYGRLGIYTIGELQQAFGDYIINQTITDGQQTYLEVLDWDGNVIFIVEPRESGGVNVYDSYGEYVDAKIKDFDNTEFEFSVENGLKTYKGIPFKYLLDENSLNIARNIGLTDNDLDNLNLNIYNSSNGHVYFNITLPSGINIEDVATELSTMFKNTTELFLGINADTSEPLSHFVSTTMRGYSMFRFIPSLAVAAYQDFGIFESAIEIASSIIHNEIVRELFIWGCNYMKNNVRNDLEIIGTSDDIGEILRAGERLNSFPLELSDNLDRLNENMGQDPNAVEMVLNKFEDLLGMIIDRGRETDTCKKSVDEMVLRQKTFYDIMMYKYDRERNPRIISNIYDDIENIMKDLFNQ